MTASTTSGTAAVTSRSARENTRTSSPDLCTWMRAPSSFSSNAASPNAIRASATLSAGDASIGSTGRNSWIVYLDSADTPSRRAAQATSPRSPHSIAAWRTAAGDAPAALATASASTPSCAPWRSSPDSRRTRKSCSVLVARPKQIGQRLRADAHRSRTLRARDSIECVVSFAEAQAGFHRRSDGARLRHDGPADTNSPLQKRTRKKRDGKAHFLRRSSLQQLGQFADLVQTPSRSRDGIRHVDQFLQLHPSMLQRQFRDALGSLLFALSAK